MTLFVVWFVYDFDVGINPDFRILALFWYFYLTNIWHKMFFLCFSFYVFTFYLLLTSD